MVTDGKRADEQKRTERQRLNQRLSQIRQRLDQAYLDKLDGKIDESFWDRKSVEWRGEEQQVLMALEGLEQATNGDKLLDAARIFELANKAYFLYVKQNPREEDELLKKCFRTALSKAQVFHPHTESPST